MAKIPRVQPGATQLSNPRISTQSPSALQTQPTGSGAGIAALGASIEQTAGALYQKMDAARNYAENAKADAYKTEFMAEKRLAESLKRNPDGSPLTSTDISDFQASLGKGKEGLKAIYTNKDEYVRAQMNWDKDALVVSHDVLKERYKNLGVVAKANDNAFFRSWALSFDGSPEALKILDDRVKSGMQNNIYDPLEADKIKEETAKKGNWNWFRTTAHMDRDKAKKMVENGEFGFDQKETDTALSTLVHYKTLEDKDELLNKINGRYDLMDAIAKGQESIYELSPQAQELIDNDDILAEAVSKAIKSKTSYYADTENEGIVKVLKEASKATDRDALSKIAASAIYRNKNISADKLGAILFYARQKAVNLQLSEKLIGPIGDETTESEIKQKQIDAGINAIARWSRMASVGEDMHGFVLSEYLKALEKGDTPLEATNRVTREANLKILPEMVNYPKEGQMLIDDKGNTKIGFPTGELKPVSIKKPIAKKESAEKSTDFSYEDLKRK